MAPLSSALCFYPMTQTYDTCYISEKLFYAVYFLATGEGDARSRVGDAYYQFWHIKPEDFPESLQAARRDIDSMLTRLSGRDGYVIPDNLRKMQNKTASKIAAMIIDLYFEVSGLEPRQKREGKT